MKKILLAILPIALSVSCSKVSGFDTPDTAVLAAEQVAKAKAFSGRTISYEALRAKATTSFATYEENDAFEGYVISSDEGGNFYKKIYVQAPDKSGTIAVSISQLATTFTNLRFEARTQANKFLVLDGVYFKTEDVGKTFHTSDNQYNTTYTLTDKAGGTLPFLTSSYAAYIKDHVPAGRLRITGVLTMYGNNPQFYINDINGIEKE